MTYALLIVGVAGLLFVRRLWHRLRGDVHVSTSWLQDEDRRRRGVWASEWDGVTYTGQFKR